MLIVENEQILDHLRSKYRRSDLNALLAFLEARGTLEFRRLRNGLFPAVAFIDAQDTSGYQYVWVRDNVHIAHAHYVWGDHAVASKTAATLMAFFDKHRNRLHRIVQDPTLAAEPMNRPHIRFDGEQLSELNQKWPHAQNDAIGYFLWFYCRLASAGMVSCDEGALACLVDIVLYLRAIAFWSDPDSGHWEEARKVSASSIGTVVAGLRAFDALIGRKDLHSNRVLQKASLDRDCVRALIDRGIETLNAILPSECLGGHSDRERRYDAALLFLVYPLDVVPNETADRILDDVRGHLEGDRGIRRYRGDSYWCPDYKSLFPAETRTADFSDNIALRDAHAREGSEAQWCLFDSIISIAYGTRAIRQIDRNNSIEQQIHYFNRALGQLTSAQNALAAFRCPEAYYLEHGRYVSNDHVPLLWAQANLKLALHVMIESTDKE
jgi:hypothetical protein